MEVSPELAQERGIETGSWVELTSRYGKVRVQAVVTERVTGKELYMPMNSVDRAGESADQQLYRQGDAYAGVQRDVGADEGVPDADGENPLPRHEFALRPSDAAERRGSRAQMEARGLSQAGERAGADSNEVDLASAEAVTEKAGQDRRSTEEKENGADRLLLKFRRAMRARNCSTRLESAPAEHAEALLDSYELLQQLHDRGVLEVAARRAERERQGGGDRA